MCDSLLAATESTDTARGGGALLRMRGALARQVAEHALVVEVTDAGGRSATAGAGIATAVWVGALDCPRWADGAKLPEAVRFRMSDWLLVLPAGAS